MPTRRSFLKLVSLTLGAAATSGPQLLVAGNSPRSLPGHVGVFIDLTEKKRSDYLSPGMHPGESDYVVLSSVVVSDLSRLKEAVEATKQKMLSNTSNPSAEIKASQATRAFKYEFYRNLLKVPPTLQFGFESYAVYINKETVPEKFRDRNGAINQASLHLALLIILLGHTGLSRFQDAFLHPNSEVLKNIPRRRILDFLDPGKEPTLGPANRIELHPRNPRTHHALQVADFLAYSILNHYQPFPVRDEDELTYRLIQRFVRKEVDAAPYLASL